jgi:hypothetical protein
MRNGAERSFWTLPDHLSDLELSIRYGHHEAVRAAILSQAFG